MSLRSRSRFRSSFEERQIMSFQPIESKVGPGAPVLQDQSRLIVLRRISRRRRHPGVLCAFDAGANLYPQQPLALRGENMEPG